MLFGFVLYNIFQMLCRCCMSLLFYSSKWWDSRHCDYGSILASCSCLIKVTLVSSGKSVAQFDSTKTCIFSQGTLVFFCSNIEPMRGAFTGPLGSTILLDGKIIEYKQREKSLKNLYLMCPLRCSKCLLRTVGNE